MPEQNERAIAVVESLKAGIPTRIATRELPDLRSGLTAQFARDLDRLAAGEIPEGRLVWGAYGQGKTHALTTIEHTALDRGFAVSRVSLSREVSCHHLFNFYGRAAAALRTPDSATIGIQRLLEMKSAEDLSLLPLHETGRYIHPLPTIVLEDYFHTMGEEQDRLYGDLLGTPTPMAELKRIHRICRGEPLPRFDINFRTTQHGAAYFGVMADVLVWGGYKGWVLLIDEVELVGRLGLAGRLQAYRNLQWLLNWSGTMTFPIYTVGVAALRLRDDVWFSGDRARSDQMRIPELAAQKFCQDAAVEMQEFFRRAVSSHCPVIEPLAEHNLIALLSKLVELHGQAHGWQARLDIPTLVAEIGNRPVRTHIRAVLEALDLALVYKNVISPEVTGLVELSVEEEESFFAAEHQEP